MPGVIGLVAANAVLLLLIILGLVAIALSNRVAPKKVVTVVVVSGLALLLLILCCGTTAGLVWHFTAQEPVHLATPTPPPPPSSSVASASVSLVPESAPSEWRGSKNDGTTILRGESISVTVALTNATELYGVEMHLRLENGLSASGLVPGTCADEFIAVSRITPAEPAPQIDSQIDFAAVRMAPSPPLTGDCEVASFTVTGEEPGTFAISFDTVILADMDGRSMPVIARDGTITVSTSP